MSNDLIPVPNIVTAVWVRTTFVGFHRWRNAPDSVKFLRDYHRHVFHVRLGVPVTGLDREVEFFTLKKELDDFLTLHYRDREFDESCEMIASFIVARFRGFFAEVSEDNENGVTVWIYEPDKKEAK